MHLFILSFLIGKQLSRQSPVSRLISLQNVCLETKAPKSAEWRPIGTCSWGNPASFSFSLFPIVHQRKIHRFRVFATAGLPPWFPWSDDRSPFCCQFRYHPHIRETNLTVGFRLLSVHEQYSLDFSRNKTRSNHKSQVNVRCMFSWKNCIPFLYFISLSQL